MRNSVTEALSEMVAVINRVSDMTREHRDLRVDVDFRYDVRAAWHFPTGLTRHELCLCLHFCAFRPVYDGF